MERYQAEGKDLPIVFTSLGKRAGNALIRSGIESVHDLLDPSFDVTKLKGVGTKTINEILAFIEKSRWEEDENTQKEGNTPLSYLHSFGARGGFVEKLGNAGLSSFEDVLNASDAKLRMIVPGGKNTKAIREAERFFRMEPGEALSKYIESELGEDAYHVFSKRAEGVVFDDLGKECGKTRERIRQIEVHTEKKLIPLLERYVASKKDAGIRVITTSAINSDVPSSGKMAGYALYLYKERIDGDKQAGVFVIHGDGKSLEDLKNLIRSVIGESGFTYEKEEALEDALKSGGYTGITSGYIRPLINASGYRISGNYIFSGSIPYGRLAIPIAEKYFPDGIKLNQESSRREPDLEKFRSILLSEYGIDLSDTEDRAIGARLSDYLIEVGRGLVNAPSRVRITDEQVAMVKDYIDRKEDDRIYYRDIFNALGDALSSSSIDNHWALHGMLKFKLPDAYEYTRDYLVKNGHDKSSFLSTGKRILSYIENEGRAVTFEELKEKFHGFSDAMILLPISEENDIIVWKERSYYSANLIKKSDEEKEELMRTTDEILEKTGGYASGEAIFREAEGKIPFFIERNDITRPQQLVALIKSWFGSSFSVGRNMITRKVGKVRVSLFQAFISSLDDKNSFSEDDVEKFRENTMPTDPVWQSFLMKVKENYIRSGERYYSISSLDPSKETVRKLGKTALGAMNDGYVTTEDILGCELPHFPLKWDGKTVTDILLKSDDVRVLFPYPNAYKTGHGIVVPGSFEGSIIDLEKMLLEKMIPKEGMRNEDVRRFLVERGLSQKTIPKELKRLDSFIHTDDGRWYIKGKGPVSEASRDWLPLFD